MISCGHPGVPANAILTGDLFTYGAVVHYSCRGSRSLVGDSSRACQEDSHWSGALPHCTGGLARAVVHCTDTDWWHPSPKWLLTHSSRAHPWHTSLASAASSLCMNACPSTVSPAGAPGASHPSLLALTQLALPFFSCFLSVLTCLSHLHHQQSHRSCLEKKSS